MPTDIFFDNNSTTPVDDRVLAAMLPIFRESFGNPSSSHAMGALAAQHIERARTQVAALCNAEPDQVVFCGSATEAINTVIASFDQGTIITSVVEHAATLESVRQAANRGARVVTLPVDQKGALDLQQLESALREGVALVTLLWANNETGVIFPIADIAKLCSTYSSPLHVDAVQAAGKLEIDFSDVPIDYLSLSSHKIFGPKGIAALIARSPRTLRPLIVGGGQENGRRGGTENVPAIVGFGVAADLAKRERVSRMKRVKSLRDRLEAHLLSRSKGVWINGASSPRLDNTSNMGFPGIDADAFVGMLSARGLFASAGSACHAHSIEPSHVIQAMTGARKLASQSVRFSLSHLNTDADVECAIATIADAHQAF